jgi:hypothetical protein
MSFRSWLGIAAVWVLSLVLTGSWASAQGQRWTPLPEPVIVSGDDIGFRVEWMNGRVPSGDLLIRVNGQWVEARIGEPPNSRIVPTPPPAPPPPR